MFCSLRQATVANSGVEDEFVALCETSIKSEWLQELLKEIFSDEEFTRSVVVSLHLQGSFQQAHSGVLSRRTEHVEVNHFFVSDFTNGKKIN
jgi:hypothetical protein